MTTESYTRAKQILGRLAEIGDALNVLDKMEKYTGFRVATCGVSVELDRLIDKSIKSTITAMIRANLKAQNDALEKEFESLRDATIPSQNT